MKLKLVTTTGKDNSMTVADEVFASENNVLLAQAVRVYMSNQRQGTSKTQRRGDVTRTTKKWYRQKGTGNARHGAQDAPIFVGGAIAHGPTGIENWKKSLTKKQIKKALAAALTAQVDNIVICDEVAELKAKTKDAVELLTKVVSKIDKAEFEQEKVLIVFAQKQPQAELAVRNLTNVVTAQARQLNALRVAQADKIILTSKAVEVLTNRIKK